MAFTRELMRNVRARQPCEIRL